jgi:hypothetical protein
MSPNLCYLLSKAAARNFHFWRAEHTAIGGEIIENP